ncbi:Carboxypeptidase M [Acipenser ruthenus]|uniref:Carboxypeptidase M n=1 Tax=Acipenser ruthenus TaxID=7906 RepID=A0A444V720_ACIRT|nr:Carboxypeptidase M [Acipenser ruthenus]
MFASMRESSLSSENKSPWISHLEMFLRTVLHCLWIGSMTSWVRGLDFNFHDSKQIEVYLQSVSKNYSTFTSLYSIGKSVQGRELWVLVLGKYPMEHKVGIPEFKYVGNMHGDETGRARAMSSLVREERFEITALAASREANLLTLKLGKYGKQT